jgi:WD40 repeat protein
MAQPRKTTWLFAAALFSPTALYPTSPAAQAQEALGSLAARVAATDRYGDPLPPGAVARLGTTRLRRQGGVANVSFSPDGRFLASTSGRPASSLFLWDRHTGRLLHQLGGGRPGQAGPFDRYVFMPGGNAILSAYARGWRLFLWDVATGREIRHWQGPGVDMTALAVSVYGLAAFADSSGVVRLWDVTKDQPPKAIPWDDRIPLGYSLAFTPDGKHLVLTGDWCEVRVLDLATRKLVHRFEPGMHKNVKLAPDGRTVATCAASDGLRLWDVATGKSRKLAEVGSDKRRFELSFSPDGKTGLALEPDGQTVRLWDVATGRVRRVQLSGEWPRPLLEVALSPDGKVVAGRDGSDRILRLWDAQTGRPLLDYPGHNLPPQQLAFSPDGRHLASFAAVDEVICWDVPRSRSLRLTHLWDKSPVGADPITRISPDGRWAALAGQKSVRLYDAGGGKVVGRIQWTGGRTADLAFSPAGDRLAVATEGGIVRIWEIPSGRPVRAIDTNRHGQAVSWLLFTPDGRALATGNGSVREPGPAGASRTEGPLRAHLWDVATGKHLLAMNADPQRWKDLALSPDWQCCFSPGGSTLYVSNAGQLLIWDVARRREAEPFQEEDEPTSQQGVAGPVAVSPDGRLLARLDVNGPLRLWETASGRKVYQFDGVYSCIAFAPDGRTLATGCDADCSVLLWDLAALFHAGKTGAAPGPSLWQDLASGNASRAYRAIWRLAGDPQAGQLLSARLEPAQERDAAPVPRLLRELDSPDFATRETATRALKEIGEPARAQLEAACKDGTSAEVRRRARAVLGELDPRSGPRLREVRAVQVLEYVGAPPARRLLEELARGAPGARLTQEAKAALERLDRRTTRP